MQNDFGRPSLLRLVRQFFAERRFTEFAHGVILTGPNHIIVGIRFLQHQPHGSDILASMAESAWRRDFRGEVDLACRFDLFQCRQQLMRPLDIGAYGRKTSSTDNPAHKSVDFVPFGQKRFCKIEIVLPGYACDQCSALHVVFL